MNVQNVELYSGTMSVLARVGIQEFQSLQCVV